MWRVLSDQILGFLAPKYPFYIWHNVITNDDKTFYKSNILKHERAYKRTLFNAGQLDPKLTKKVEE